MGRPKTGLPFLLLDSLSVGLKRLESGELSLDKVDCPLGCRFCAHGISKSLKSHRGALRALEGRLLAAPDFTAAARLRAITTRLERWRLQRRLALELAAMPPHQEPVVLGGWDALEHPDFAELVAQIWRAGKTVHVVTPGIRLSDRAMVRALRPFTPRFTLTYLSLKTAVYDHMAGLPGAKALVDRAIENLVSEGLHPGVNILLTSQNCHELTDIAGFLRDARGIRAINVLVLRPDWGCFQLDPTFGEQLPSYRDVALEVERCVIRLGARGHILNLWNIPPCVLSPRLLASGRIEITMPSPDPAHPVSLAEDCARCVLRPECRALTPWYRQRFPDERFRPLDAWPTSLRRDAT